MDLPHGEPECGPWRPIDAAELLTLLLADPVPSGRPRIIGVDGRGGSGKTTLAGAIATESRILGMITSIVSTDDVAWHLSFFDWDRQLADGVLRPARDGRGAHYRPAAWQQRGRDGAVVVPREATLVVVEGSGVLRRSLVPLLDTTVWVQVDHHVADARLRQRDGDTPACQPSSR